VVTADVSSPPAETGVAWVEAVRLPVKVTSNKGGAELSPDANPRTLPDIENVVVKNPEDAAAA
jgi:hypothetical protein